MSFLRVTYCDLYSFVNTTFIFPINLHYLQKGLKYKPDYMKIAQRYFTIYPLDKDSFYKK